MRVLSLVVAIATAGVLAASASATPIADAGTPSIPTHQGGPVEANPIKHATKPEQNPNMAANPNSNIHNDTWMTDAYNRKGPLGESPVTDSYSYPSSLCGSLAFDSQGRIISVCPSIRSRRRRGSSTRTRLAPIDTLDLPTAPNPPGQNEYQNFAGGGYFFLDQKDRIWVPTRTDHIFVIATAGGKARGRARLRPDRRPRHGTERITSALPDFDGARSGSSRSRTARSARSTRRPGRSS